MTFKYIFDYHTLKICQLWIEKKKIENERSQLVNRGIIPESYEESVTEAPSLRPTPRGPVAVNKPKGRAQIVHEDEDEEEEEEEEEEEYG